MIKTKKALVTGGGGFLGSAIVRMLLARGVEVHSFARHHYPALDSSGVTQIQGDIGDSRQVHQACQGVDAVFHTAARAGLGGRFQSYYQTNVLGTENIIHACMACDVARLIHTSSPSVVFHGGDMAGVDESAPYPAAFHAHYPRTKAMAEKRVIEAARQGLGVIVLRPHLIWGPGDNHLVPGILKRAARLRRVGDGTNRVDTIYVDNAAEAHLLADKALAANPGLTGNIYFLSQDEPMPLWEMINHILAAGGKPPVTKTISPGLAYHIGKVCEWIYALLGLDADPPMTRFMARELATSHWFDITAAKRDLGYKPRISTEEGLHRLAKWLRKAN
jgi:nucleoside-diphosphate-sugar epimerase